MTEKSLETSRDHWSGNVNPQIPILTQCNGVNVLMESK